MTTNAHRAALAAHNASMAEHRAKHDAARQPITELDAKIDKARADIVAAEKAQLAAHAAEAQAIIENGHCIDHADAVATATAHLDRCRRVLAALEAKRAELEAALRDVELNRQIAASGTEELIGDVVNDVVAQCLDDLTAKRRAAAGAEAAIRTLAAAVRGKGWLPLLEKVNIALNTAPVIRWEDQSYPAWDRFIEALAVDAHAPIPAVQS
jgi:hypothetical protein